jgi:hypothetical protein
MGLRTAGSFLAPLLCAFLRAEPFEMQMYLALPALEFLMEVVGIVPNNPAYEDHQDCPDNAAHI